MINYSLRYARLFKKKEDIRWPSNVKKEFDKRLDEKIESMIEFSVTLGEYLPNLLYLDKKWVNDNINNIFPKGNNKHWEAAFIGYLSHSSTLYSSIYFVLRDNGHYNKALETKFKDEHTTERLVQHICVGYIEEWEKLSDKKSLIYLLLNKGDFNQISQIVRFFWMHKNKLDEKKKLKIKPLWKALFEILFKKEEVKEAQEIISSLSKWVSIIDNIDKELFEWIKLSAKYVQVDYNTTFFIEYLLKHVSKTPELVSEIYLEMIKVKAYPDYEKEHIREIVETLYEKKQNTNADKICNMYLGKGFDFLKDIYEKHRK